MSSYQSDTLEVIYNDLKETEGETLDCGRSIKKLSEEAAKSRGDYELLKNKKLIELYREESKPDFTGKRTEAQRTADYRAQYSDERLSANLAEQSLKAERDYLSALQSKLMSLQTRARLLEAESKFRGQI